VAGTKKNLRQAKFAVSKTLTPAERGGTCPCPAASHDLASPIGADRAIRPGHKTIGIDFGRAAVPDRAGFFGDLRPSCQGASPRVVEPQAAAVLTTGARVERQPRWAFAAGRVFQDGDPRTTDVEKIVTRRALAG